MILCKDRANTAINKEQIKFITKGDVGYGGEQAFWIQLNGNNILNYDNVGDRNSDYLVLANAIQPQESKLNYLKEYLAKNRDTIFTIALVILIDHFVFNGAFREKIKGTVEKMLARTDKAIEA